MTEKKKIALWAAVVVLLILAILFLLLGNKEDAETQGDTKQPYTEIQQEAEETPAPTATPGVVELPFIPVD